MRIKTSEKDRCVIFPLSLGERPVGVLNGKVEVDSTEIQEIRKIAYHIWRVVGRMFSDFVGLVRFDWIPKFDGAQLKVKGIYEVNTSSPECIAALAALRIVRPDLVSPEAHRRFVEVVRDTFEFSQLPIVIGKGVVKQTWGRYMREVLVENGLPLVPFTEEEAMTISPLPVLWRWGDIGEFSSKFVKYLYTLRKDVKIFNTLPRQTDGFYPGHKELLVSSKEIKEYVGFACRLGNLRNLPAVLSDRRRLVLKPLNGSSGQGIVFGKLIPGWAWPLMVLKKIAHRGYGAFEAQWLPRVSIAGQDFALDFNSAFWVKGEGRELKYLHSIVRFVPFSYYEDIPVVNVTRGGFFASVWET